MKLDKVDSWSNLSWFENHLKDWNNIFKEKMQKNFKKKRNIYPPWRCEKLIGFNISEKTNRRLFSLIHNRKPYWFWIVDHFDFKLFD